MEKQGKNTGDSHAELHQCSVEELMQALRDGNASAEILLYKRYHKSALLKANSIIKNQADAEEAVNDAFLNVFKKIKENEPVNDFKAYLMKSVINLSIDFVKARKKGIILLFSELSDDGTLPDWLEEYPEANQPHPEQAVQEALALQALAELPDTLRKVLEMHYLEGQPYAEIAELLGRNKNQVKNIAYRVRAALKEELENIL